LDFDYKALKRVLKIKDKKLFFRKSFTTFVEKIQESVFKNL